jgi:DNA ligase-1
LNKSQRWKGIMKCYPFEERRLAKWEPPYIVQPKYDGVRCRAVPLNNGDFLLLSSEENPIFSVPHINKAMKELLPSWEFDGELYCHEMSFEEIVSITSRTVNLHPDHNLIGYHIFDIVRENQFQGTRLAVLNSLRTELRTEPCLTMSPFWICESLDDIMRTYDKLIETGYEGIIVRHLEAFYERKRSTWIMKFKPKKEDLYDIIGSEEEISIKGTPKGSLGALVCSSGDGQTFRVGTGFTEDERRILWNVREQLPGKAARVSYQHLTNRKVPRFPVFTEIIEKGEPVI